MRNLSNRENAASISGKPIPDIVRPVLRTVGRLWHQGELSQKALADKIDRLTREELEPRGLSLTMEEGTDGWMRFSIHQRRDGTLRELITCEDEVDLTGLQTLDSVGATTLEEERLNADLRGENQVLPEFTVEDRIICLSHRR